MAQSTLKDFMTSTQRSKLNNLPNPDTDSNGNVMTTHRNCLLATGVARPGKTARDRANRGDK